MVLPQNIFIIHRYQSSDYGVDDDDDDGIMIDKSKNQ